MVPGIVFTIPSQSKYVTAAAHAVLFVIVHHVVNAYLKKHFGMDEPSLSTNKQPVSDSVVVSQQIKPEKKVVIIDPKVTETQQLTSIQKAQLLENVPENVY